MFWSKSSSHLGVRGPDIFSIVRTCLQTLPHRTLSKSPPYPSQVGGRRKNHPFQEYKQHNKNIDQKKPNQTKNQTTKQKPKKRPPNQNKIPTPNPTPNLSNFTSMRMVFVSQWKALYVLPSFTGAPSLAECLLSRQLCQAMLPSPAHHPVLWKRVSP